MNETTTNGTAAPNGLANAPAPPAAAVPAAQTLPADIATTPSVPSAAEKRAEERLLLVKRVFDTFLKVWGAVPRSVRPEKEHQERYLFVKEWFMSELARTSEKKASLEKQRLAGEVTEDQLPLELTPIRQAARVCRVLERHEWEMLKVMVDLSMKFPPEAVLDVMDDLRDTHCADCGEWLDEEDPHEDCPANAEAMAPAEAGVADPVADAEAAARIVAKTILDELGSPLPSPPASPPVVAATSVAAAIDPTRPAT